jgi:hypothetical protein
MYLRIVNKSPQVFDGFAFALNENALGIPSSINSGEVGKCVTALRSDTGQIANIDKSGLQIAPKSLGVVYAVLPEGNIGQDAFKERFQRFTATAAFIVDGIAGVRDRQK